MIEILENSYIVLLILASLFVILAFLPRALHSGGKTIFRTTSVSKRIERWKKFLSAKKSTDAKEADTEESRCRDTDR